MTTAPQREPNTLYARRHGTLALEVNIAVGYYRVISFPIATPPVRRAPCVHISFFFFFFYYLLLLSQSKSVMGENVSMANGCRSPLTLVRDTKVGTKQVFNINIFYSHNRESRPSP